MTFFYCAILVNCGSPLLPPNGYIIQSNDTTEGSSISFVCLTAHPETAVVYTSTCNQAGDWEPRPTDICQLGMCDNIIVMINFLYPTL